MKTFIYILLAISSGVLIYNSTNIDVTAPLQGESKIAIICTLAAACVIVLLITLLVSKKISEKIKS